MLTLPEHQMPISVFMRVCIVQALVLNVVFLFVSMFVFVISFLLLVLPFFWHSDFFICAFDLLRRYLLFLPSSWSTGNMATMGIFFSDCLIFQKSFPLKPIGQMEPNYIWEVLYKNSLFRPDPTTNMATTGYSCFWLADISKLFSSATTCLNVTMLDRKTRLLTDIS